MKLESTTKKDFASDREIERKQLVAETIDEALLLLEVDAQEGNVVNPKRFIEFARFVVTELKLIREQFN